MPQTELNPDISCRTHAASDTLLFAGPHSLIFGTYPTGLLEQNGVSFYAIRPSTPDNPIAPNHVVYETVNTRNAFPDLVYKGDSLVGLGLKLDMWWSDRLLTSGFKEGQLFHFHLNIGLRALEPLRDEVWLSKPMTEGLSFSELVSKFYFQASSEGWTALLLSMNGDDDIVLKIGEHGPEFPSSMNIGQLNNEPSREEDASAEWMGQAGELQYRIAQQTPAYVIEHRNPEFRFFIPDDIDVPNVGCIYEFIVGLRFPSIVNSLGLVESITRLIENRKLTEQDLRAVVDPYFILVPAND